MDRKKRLNKETYRKKPRNQEIFNQEEEEEQVNDSDDDAQNLDNNDNQSTVDSDSIPNNNSPAPVPAVLRTLERSLSRSSEESTGQNTVPRVNFDLGSPVRRLRPSQLQRQIVTRSVSRTLSS